MRAPRSSRWRASRAPLITVGAVVIGLLQALRYAHAAREHHDARGDVARGVHPIDAVARPRLSQLESDDPPSRSSRRRADEVGLASSRGELAPGVEVPTESNAVAKPAVRGRIVERGSQRAVPHAAGVFVMTCAGGESVGTVFADDGGRFRVLLTCPPVRTIAITLSAPGLGRAVVELTDVPSGGEDLGDVELEPANDFYFLAQGVDGAPIAGAVARVSVGGEGALLRSTPTAIDGRSVLRSLPDASRAVAASRSVSNASRSVIVEALGFEAKTVRVGDEGFTEALPLTVVLARRPALHLLARARDGSVLRDVLVRVTLFDERPFASDAGPSADAIQSDLGAPRARKRSIFAERAAPSSLSGPRMILTYVVDGHGALFVPGLRPMNEFEVAVEDRAGDVVASRTVDPALLDQNIEIVLRADREASSLDLVATDELGNRLAGAEVSRADGDEILASTDTSGVARIESLYARELDVVVCKAGFAPRRFSERALGAPRDQRTIVLDAGRTMLVRVVDARGADAAIDGLRARFEGRFVGRGRIVDDNPSGDDGRGGDHDRSRDHAAEREFHDLPLEPFDWIVTVGGRRIPQRCDSGAESALIVLPPSGSLSVEIASNLIVADGVELVLRAESTDAIVAVRAVEPARAASVRFAVLFPGRYALELRERGQRAPDRSVTPAARNTVEVQAGEEARVVLTGR